RLITRYGPAVVIALGSAVFGAGVSWWAIAMGLQPDYISDALGGMILTGIGVGLTLPTMMATASSSLPPPSFASGSAVVNMIRQTGLALGVAALVAVLGTAATHGLGELEAFRRAWWFIAAISFLGIVPAFALLQRPGPAEPGPRRARGDGSEPAVLVGPGRPAGSAPLVRPTASVGPVVLSPRSAPPAPVSRSRPGRLRP
ncbi:MAG: MFS transporter, partial [Acidimicrobiales bacterium]